MTEAEIKAKYKKLHDDLTKSYYSGKSGLSKAEFDHQHGQVWADMEAELIAEGLLPEPKPARDLTAEVDGIKDTLEVLEKAVGDVALDVEALKGAK